MAEILIALFIAFALLILGEEAISKVAATGGLQLDRATIRLAALFRRDHAPRKLAARTQIRAASSLVLICSLILAASVITLVRVYAVSRELDTKVQALLADRPESRKPFGEVLQPRFDAIEKVLAVSERIEPNLQVKEVQLYKKYEGRVIKSLYTFEVENSRQEMVDQFHLQITSRAPAPPFAALRFVCEDRDPDTSAYSRAQVIRRRTLPRHVPGHQLLISIRTSPILHGERKIIRCQYEWPWNESNTDGPPMVAYFDPRLYGHVEKFGLHLLVREQFRSVVVPFFHATTERFLPSDTSTDPWSSKPPQAAYQFAAGSEGALRISRKFIGDEADDTPYHVYCLDQGTPDGESVVRFPVAVAFEIGRKS